MHTDQIQEAGLGEFNENGVHDLSFFACACSVGPLVRLIHIGEADLRVAPRGARHVAESRTIPIIPITVMLIVLHAIKTPSLPPPQHDSSQNKRFL